MTDVFFRGYGSSVGFYQEDWSGEPEEPEYVSGIFSLSEEDETMYKHTKNLTGVYKLQSTNHPDCAISKMHRQIPSPLCSKVEDCYFLIRHDGIMVLEVVDPCFVEECQELASHDEIIEPSSSKVVAWRIKAREIGIRIHSENQDINIEKIAEKTHTEMTALNAEGKPGMTGRSGKVPAATTIKRHALTGIKA